MKITLSEFVLAVVGETLFIFFLFFVFHEGPDSKEWIVRNLVQIFICTCLSCSLMRWWMNSEKV